MEEDKIIQLLKQNDQQAISYIYDKYAASLYGIVLKIVPSEAIAEDVLQESFVKVWKRGSTYDPSKGTLFTWLLNITRNTAIDKLRSAGYRKQEKIQQIDHSVYKNGGASHELNVDALGLNNVVDSLEEKYRIVVDLIYFQGFTQKEVEEHLNIPIGTVKSRVRIALRELRKIFDAHQVLLTGLVCLTSLLQAILVIY
jgi:RNA polymerase sigma factor (sigma-70 family)